MSASENKPKSPSFSALSTEPYKGTRDFYPADMQFRRWMFDRVRSVVQGFGYLEYAGPMLEPFDLYAAKTGEEIVNQQLFTLTDKADRRLAVRPEMTPTMARMVAGKIHELPRPIRWFSIPNLWRYERPQRGRLREHWQLNVDVLGGDSLLADAEVLMIAIKIIKCFSKTSKPNFAVIRLNHRGLMDAFFSDHLGLNPEQAHQVVKAIDAKNKIDTAAFVEWVKRAGVKDTDLDLLQNFFGWSLEEVIQKVPCEGARHLQKLMSLLQDSGLVTMGPNPDVIFDPTVMRGMDYYTGVTFEIYDQSPENRRAMFGGGRYDNLIGMFGKESLSGVGFGMGDASLELFLRTHELVPTLPSEIDVFISLPDLTLRSLAEKIAQEVRSQGWSVATPLGVGAFGAQLKQANRMGAKIAVLFGETELKLGKVLVKNLKTGTQDTVDIADVSNQIRLKVGEFL